MRHREFAVHGPFRDKAKRGQPKEWFLRYAVPNRSEDGTPLLDADGKAALRYHRPYYESKAKAMADIPRLVEQFGETGHSTFVQSRAAVEEYEQAKQIAPEVSLVEVAKFWRLHHPVQDTKKIVEILPTFLADVERRVGKTRHWEDLKSRLNAAFLEQFGERIPETVTRHEVMAYLNHHPGAGRTVLNEKRAICNFFGYLVQEGIVTQNVASGIKKRQLPRIDAKEVRFLSLDHAARYIRAAERYDPELVAHEIVQLISGVRSDDEMANFDGSWVHPETREIVIPADIAKTGKREVINELEENFWSWWSVYGRKGLLRPKNYEPRWNRVRVLAAIKDVNEADRQARLPIKRLLASDEAKSALANWPWNGRRRTFCTYHVAKHQSAEKTALILRHRGDSYTLHESYRGLGVTQDMGRKYFEILPSAVKEPIRPEYMLRGIILLQKGNAD